MAATVNLKMPLPIDEKVPLDAPPPYTPLSAPLAPPALPSAGKDVSEFELQAWNRALDMFRAGPHRSDRIDEFLQTHKTPQEVKKVCQERRKKASDASGTIMAKIFSKIDIFLTAGNIAVKAAPESIGLAWTGISLVLGSAQDDYQTLQVFGNGCADIIGIMIACRVFTKMFSIQSGPEDLYEIQGKVVDEVPKLYAKILEFSYQAWKFVGKNQAIRILSSLLNKHRDAIAAQFGDIRVGNENLSRFAAQATDALLRINQEETMRDVKAIKSALEESASLSKELTRTIDDLRRQLDEQKKRSPMEVAKDTFERQKKQLMYRTDVEAIQAKRLGIRSKGTCTWVFDDKDYRKWYDAPKSDILFIYGDGNMGKSILVSSIIEVLQQKSQESDKILTEYFFCSNGDDHAQKTDRVFDQVLYAIYKHVPSSLEVMDKCNESVKRYLAKRPRDAVGGKQSEKSPDEEKPLNFDEAFKNLAVHLKKDVFLVIDALDECMDREQCGLISSILALVSEAKATTQQTGTRIKLILSGRPYKDITSGLRDVTHQISIRKHNESDIKTYTRAALEEIPDMTQAERAKACDVIVHKADAVFGYVGPALDTFRKPWRRPLEDHLNALPNDHLRMNAQILARIDPSYVEFLKMCLTWTILANGDQKVKIEEVIDAYSRVYVSGSTEWKREKLDETQIKFYREQIQTAGSSFLEVDTETREISLVKPPIVKESFLDPQKKPEPAEQQTTCLRCRSHDEARKGFSFTERDGHLQIAQTILNHLNAPLFQSLYLDTGKNTGSDSKYPTGNDDAPKKNEENEIKEDGEPSSGESGGDGSNTVPNTNGSVPKTTEGHHKQEDGTVEAQAPIETTTNESTSAPPAEVPSADPTTLPSENSNTPKQPDTAEHGNDPNANVNGATERVPSADSDKGATSDNESGKDAVASESTPDKETLDDEDDVLSEADTDYHQEEPTTAATWEEPVEEKPRYEISQWMYHLQQAEKFWKDAPKTDEWEKLWNDAIAFLDSKAFSSTHMESSGGGPDVIPLHCVAGNGLVELTRRLLKRNPMDCHAKDQWGSQPLHYAAMSSYEDTRLEIYKLLLDAGANPNQGDEEPIYWASPFLAMLSWYPNHDAARLFLDHGADATKKEHIDSKWTSLHLLTLSCKDPRIVKLLIDAGADVNAVDYGGETPLHKLVRHHDCNLEVLDAFLEAGADVNKDDNESQRPLYEASQAGNLELAEKLLQHGADIHDTDVEDMTALHVAAENGHKDIVSLLLKHGADPTKLDKKQRTPFYLACGSKNSDVARLLADELLQRDPSLIDKPSSTAKTPFRKACARGNLDIAKFLLDYHRERSTSAEVNTADSQLGRSALHAAAYFGSESVVAFLLSRGAQMGLRDKQHKTPLKLAYENWAQCLDDHSKNESYQNLIIQLIATDRETAVADTELLHVAAIKGCVPILKTLLHEEPKADPNARDEHGWTAIAYAKQYRKKEAEELLVAHGGTVGRFPSAWRSTNPKKVVVSEDGLEVWQAEAARDLATYQARHTLFSDHPIPSGIQRYYYEITLSAADNPKPDIRPEISFGVSQFRPNEKQRRCFIPGVSMCNSKGIPIPNNINSWGYHGDDGSCCESVQGQGSRCVQMEGYDPGDTVGCAIDVTKGTLFFTKNGRRMRDHMFDDVSGRLHCAVGLSEPIKARANFTGNFMWKPANTPTSDWDADDSADGSTEEPKPEDTKDGAPAS